MARDVFISYNSEDLVSAERLRELLERNGISCWIAPRDVPPGHPWPVAIADGIRRSNVLLLVLSQNSRDSKQIARELELADKSGLRILTFRLGNISPPKSLEYFLTNLQWIDGFGSQFDSGARKLIDSIRHSDSFPAPATVGHINAGDEPISGLSTDSRKGPRRRIWQSTSGDSKPSRHLGRNLAIISGMLLLAGAIAFHFFDGLRKQNQIDLLFKTGIEDADRRDDVAAIASFSRVLDLDPDNAAALQNRAEAYYREKNEDSALHDLDREMLIKGARPEGIHLLKGKIFKRLRKYPDALSEYTSFLASKSVGPRDIEFAEKERDEIQLDIDLEPFTRNWFDQFDKGSTAKAWVDRTREYGSPKHRTFDHCARTSDNSVVCAFRSSFQKAHSVTETIKLSKGEDDAWTVSGYEIKSK